MSKHFLLNPKIESLAKEDILAIRERGEKLLKTGDLERRQRQQKSIAEECVLKHVDERVIVVVNLQLKNSHRFSNGTEIRLERAYNNFNRRITEPVNAYVISADNIHKGSEILISHNALHDVNLITDYNPLSGNQSEDIKYYSLPIDDCFAWKDTNGEWQPFHNFEFGLRLFRPYKGKLQGVEPALIKDALYITTGELKGNVCNTLKASDYEIIYQGEDGREKRLIRFRHSPKEDYVREEVICINHELTEQVNNHELLMGYEIKDAKTLLQWQEQQKNARK